MGLGTPWVDSYLEDKQKEQSSVIFMNQPPKIYQILSSD